MFYPWKPVHSFAKARAFYAVLGHTMNHHWMLGVSVEETLPSISLPHPVIFLITWSVTSYLSRQSSIILMATGCDPTTTQVTYDRIYLKRLSWHLCELASAA